MNNLSFTDRSDGLQQYLNDIHKYPLLTEEEEEELGRRIQESVKKGQKPDQEVVDKLVMGNLRIVVTIAKDFQNAHTSLNNLINEGNMGLIFAAQRFDPSYGFKFISYAKQCIEGHIKTALSRKLPPVKLPKVKNIKAVKQGYKDLTHQLDREPTCEELALHLRTEPSEIKPFFESVNVFSLNTVLGNDEEEGSEYMNFLVGEDPRENNPLERVTRETLQHIADLLFPKVSHIQRPGPRDENNKKGGERTRFEKAAELKDILERTRGIGPYLSPQDPEDIADSYNLSYESIRQKIEMIKRSINIAHHKGPHHNPELIKFLREQGIF